MRRCRQQPVPCSSRSPVRANVGVVRSVRPVRGMWEPAGTGHGTSATDGSRTHRQRGPLARPGGGPRRAARSSVAGRFSGPRDFRRRRKPAVGSHYPRCSVRRRRERCRRGKESRGRSRAIAVSCAAMMVTASTASTPSAMAPPRLGISSMVVSLVRTRWVLRTATLPRARLRWQWANKNDFSGSPFELRRQCAAIVLIGRSLLAQRRTCRRPQDDAAVVRPRRTPHPWRPRRTRTTPRA